MEGDMLTRGPDEWKVIKQDTFFLLLEGDRAVYGPFKTEGKAYDYMYGIINARNKNAKGLQQTGTKRKNAG
jgi:hypothetical protein